MIYIAIPIYSDPFLHPQHKNNKLSLLYVREVHGNDVDNWDASKSYILPQLHPDSKEYMVDYSFLMNDNQIVMTPDAKKLIPILPEYRKILDVNVGHWWLHGKPMDLEIRNNAIDFLSNKYYNVKKLNEIVPIIKHKEYCDEMSDKILEWVKRDLNPLIDDEGWFDNSGALDTIEAF